MSDQVYSVDPGKPQGGGDDGHSIPMPVKDSTGTETTKTYGENESSKEM